MRKHHDLKCQRRHYRAAVDGYKPFELRRNDRDFKEGDTVTLIEVHDEDYGGHTGRTSPTFVITYLITEGPWLQPGFCCFGIRKHDR